MIIIGAMMITRTKITNTIMSITIVVEMNKLLVPIMSIMIVMKVN